MHVADINHLQASAVCYEATGAIVGGGPSANNLDIPAGGSLDVSIRADITGTPSSCEVYADNIGDLLPC
jgi:hypothetical protein